MLEQYQHFLLCYLASIFEDIPIFFSFFFFLAFLHDSLTIVTCKFATRSLLHDFSWFHVGLQPSWCDRNFQYDLVNDFCHTATEVLNVEFNFLFFLADLIGYFVKDADLCTE